MAKHKRTEFCNRMDTYAEFSRIQNDIPFIDVVKACGKGANLNIPVQVISENLKIQNFNEALIAR